VLPLFLLVTVSYFPVLACGTEKGMKTLLNEYLYVQLCIKPRAMASHAHHVLHRLPHDYA